VQLSTVQSTPSSQSASVWQSGPVEEELTLLEETTLLELDDETSADELSDEETVEDAGDDAAAPPAPPWP
jgi:hypothetical protein